jgi:hypothetical protein
MKSISEPGLARGEKVIDLTPIFSSFVSVSGRGFPSQIRIFAG